MELLIGGWSETSLVDVLEHVSFTVWLAYCNFRCPWCSNSRLARGLDAKRVPVDEVVEAAADAAPFVDYFHVTGGEPTLQAAALTELLRRVARRTGLPLSLDTNASTPRILQRLLSEVEVDHIAIDVKAPLDDPAGYARATGLPLRLAARLLPLVREGVRLAARHARFLELRSTMAPGILDAAGVARVAGSIAALGLEPRGRAVYVVQQFIPYEGVPEAFRQRPATPPEEVYEAARRVELPGFEVWARTLADGAKRIK